MREYVEECRLISISPDGLTEAQIVALCVKLCDILIYLHGLKPPVIHRDIKPQNIIVKANGEISLIDFDIARTYDDEAKTDTQFIGTRTYAPPEQYGFSQTDCRADIYSLGVLLCYMLTGDTDVKKAAISNKRLASIVRRCAAFSPEERYSDMTAVKKALLDTDGHKRKRIVRALGVAAFMLLALFAGFVVGRYTSFLAPPATVDGVQFAEPLMEQAVRVQLGIDEAETITEADLLSVREIYIFGNEYQKQKSHSRGSAAARCAPWGRSSLEDELLPNLKCYMSITRRLSTSPGVRTRIFTTKTRCSTFVGYFRIVGMKQQITYLFDTHPGYVAAWFLPGSILARFGKDAHHIPSAPARHCGLGCFH